MVFGALSKAAVNSYASGIILFNLRKHLFTFLCKF